MKLYRIRNWNIFFENNRSRELKNLTRAVLPNKHDGETYTMLISAPHGPEMFAAWCLMAQVASKCNPRGTLVRSDGTPLSPLALSVKTRAPVEIFEMALEWLEKNSDWLEVTTVNQQHTEVVGISPQAPAGLSQEPAELSHVVTTEQNRTEQNRTIVQRLKFSPPDYLEALAYSVEISLPEYEVQKFMDFYESKGWKVGKVGMKDWRAAMRNWKRNSRIYEANHTNNRQQSLGLDAAERGKRTQEIVRRRMAKEFRDGSGSSPDA